MNALRPRPGEGFRTSERGVAAVEFGLLAPFLILVLVTAIELGRAYQAFREFESGVTGIAREVAGFPEFDSRARAHAPYFANVLLPPDWNGKFNMQVTSLRKDQGVMKQVFTHTLFGNNPNVSATDAVKESAFDQNEYTIVFAASYDYTPLFKLFVGKGCRMKKTYYLNPFFSRDYVYNAGQSADKYVY